MIARRSALSTILARPRLRALVTNASIGLLTHLIRVPAFHPQDYPCMSLSMPRLSLTPALVDYPPIDLASPLCVHELAEILAVNFHTVEGGILMRIACRQLINRPCCPHALSSFQKSFPRSCHFCSFGKINPDIAPLVCSRRHVLHYRVAFFSEPVGTITAQTHIGVLLCLVDVVHNTS